MVIGRGQIWWADLPAAEGSALAFRRPVVVVQADVFNRSAIATSVIVPITSNLRLAALPGNVLLPRRATGLPRDSVANVSQIVTIDKAVLTEMIARLPRPLLRLIDEGLRLVIGL